MGLPCDWQIKKQKLLERSQYLLETGQWSDCKFIVGQEPHQQTLKGHKLFLAMSSPVFEAMFFGGMAEKNDLIPIRDVQPEAFKALLEYIYTDRVDLNSFELACELCYCAKKYMLPSLVEACTKYLWSDVSPKKACRAYEFAKLFEEPVLMDKCLHIICTKTNEVLKEPNWEEIEFGTLLTVLEQENLQINSEMELFNAVERWAKAECTRKSLDSNDGKSLKSVIGNALSKIRFLSLNPQEFAEGTGMSPLLTQDETFAILMNILCTGNTTPMPEGFSTNLQGRANLHLDIFGKYRSARPRSNCSYIQYVGSSNTLRNTPPIIIENGVRKDAENLSVNNSSPVIVEGGVRDGPKYYCQRVVLHPSHCVNTNVLDCSVTFSVDKNICVLGVQIPTQILRPFAFQARDDLISYNEILYAHLLDSDNTRLTYTHFTTKADFNSLVEITFNRPVYIQRNKVYRVGVVFNKLGWYPMGVCTENVLCNSVFFTFGVGNSSDDVRNGLIRSIVFTYQGVTM
ncbi:BTB/POZ domain-containing protein 6-A [Habropoda laboriosa]|uniref:BTB/POZ domain-containing protein 6-A n=1 Tax=Habropoda laboriosa TaxID=597456 RepID=A0A0L7R9N0_9HYME|nr:BTB/POZ domain-containing protein 6-A [Habropoda laboriosa]